MSGKQKEKNALEKANEKDTKHTIMRAGVEAGDRVQPNGKEGRRERCKEESEEKQRKFAET